MSIKLSSLLIVAAALCPFWADAQGPGLPLSLSIEPKLEHVQTGAPVGIKITVTNTSSHDVGYVTRDPDNYKIVVSDEHGKVIGPAFRKEATVTMRNFIVAAIKPKESVTEELTLNDSADFTKPGTYWIRVLRPLSKELGKGSVASNAIKIVIDEPAK
jgi:hypothetical protein